ARVRLGGVNTHVRSTQIVEPVEMCCRGENNLTPSRALEIDSGCRELPKYSVIAKTLERPGVHLRTRMPSRSIPIENSELHRRCNTRTPRYRQTRAVEGARYIPSSRKQLWVKVRILRNRSDELNVLTNRSTRRPSSEIDVDRRGFPKYTVNVPRRSRMLATDSTSQELSKHTLDAYLRMLASVRYVPSACTLVIGHSRCALTQCAIDEDLALHGHWMIVKSKLHLRKAYPKRGRAKRR
ncbi:hypothetical protein SCHPADRAFT_897500, partial [Schizopora paradoxa]